MPARYQECFRRHFQHMMDMDEEAQQEDENLMNIFFDNSNDEAIPKRQQIIGQIPNKDWDAYSGYQRLMADYLYDNAVVVYLGFKHQMW